MRYTHGKPQRQRRNRLRALIAAGGTTVVGISAFIMLQSPDVVGGALPVSAGKVHESLASQAGVSARLADDDGTGAKNNPKVEGMKLKIPSIGLTSDVELVGITPEGNMDVPRGSRAGLYESNPYPGEAGTAVIAGHVNTRRGDGIFKNLQQIKAGDIVKVSKESAEKQFRVVDVQEYNADNVPLDKIYGSDQSSRLNLITCTGEYLKDARTYDKRLVVYTELVQ